MPSIINSDDGVVSGTSGLKTTGGNDGLLNIQSNGSTVVAVTGSGISVTGTVSQTGVSTFAAGTVSAPSITFTGDTNTGIFSPAADTIAFTEGGTEAMRINSSGNLVIADGGSIDIAGGANGGNAPSLAGIRLGSATGGKFINFTTVGQSAEVTGTIQSWNSVTNASSARITLENAGAGNNGIITFATTNSAVGSPTERARITSDGVFAVGKTSTDSNTVGASMRTDGYCTMTRSANKCLDVNRQTNDGTLVSFLQDNTEEGSISVSGNTVSYNAFAGGHWTQLPEGRGYNPEILRGTVMSTIGEMCEWKSVVWDEVIEHPAVPAVEAKEAVLDEEGNVVEPAVEAVEGKDAWTETINKREAYLGQLPVGATFTEDGVTKTVVDDGNERLPKVKISDVVGDKAVYGVFQTWDEVQDMLVTSLGAFVIRIAAGVTVQIGDLLESNGDGCAKVQDDDVIRSKTIGKVTSTTPSATYADGSYTVPAVLYCG